MTNTKDQDAELIDILEPHYWNQGFKQGKDAQEAARKSGTYELLKAREERLVREARIHENQLHIAKFYGASLVENNPTLYEAVQPVFVKRIAELTPTKQEDKS